MSDLPGGKIKAMEGRFSMIIATYTDIGSRPVNEDTVKYVKNDKGSLCVVVADGLGGHGGGETASRITAKTICDGWNGSTDGDALEELIQKAHKKVVARQVKTCMMKSTVTALWLTKDHATWAHAGDTRIYHFIDGKLVFQTKDHSASQIAVTLGQIKPSQIRFSEDRSKVLKAVGQEGILTPEVGEEDLVPGKHAFLLCTDGFWEYVLENEMEADLREACGPKDWLARMLRRLMKQIPPDNDNNTAAAVWMDV